MTQNLNLSNAYSIFSVFSNDLEAAFQKEKSLNMQVNLKWVNP